MSHRPIRSGNDIKKTVNKTEQCDFEVCDLKVHTHNYIKLALQSISYLCMPNDTFVASPHCLQHGRTDEPRETPRWPWLIALTSQRKVPRHPNTKPAARNSASSVMNSHSHASQHCELGSLRTSTYNAHAFIHKRPLHPLFGCPSSSITSYSQRAFEPWWL